MHRPACRGHGEPNAPSVSTVKSYQLPKTMSIAERARKGSSACQSRSEGSGAARPRVAGGIPRGRAMTSRLLRQGRESPALRSGGQRVGPVRRADGRPHRNGQRMPRTIHLQSRCLDHPAEELYRMVPRGTGRVRARTAKAIQGRWNLDPRNCLERAPERLAEGRRLARRVGSSRWFPRKRTTERCAPPGN